MAGHRFLKNTRLHAFITGYVLILSGLAYFGYVELSRFDEAQKAKARAEAHEDLPSVNASKGIYRLPRMELTLSSFEGETHHARIGLSLEIEKSNMERFVDFQPRVSDRIIDFLRHQDINEIRQPKAMYELRRDLVEQANKASGPVAITDVIFREFVVR